MEGSIGGVEPEEKHPLPRRKCLIFQLTRLYALVRRVMNNEFDFEKFSNYLSGKYTKKGKSNRRLKKGSRRKKKVKSFHKKIPKFEALTSKTIGYNDLSIKDSTVDGGVYNFQHVRPYYVHEVELSDSMAPKIGTKSLRLLCSMEIARNCESLRSAHIVNQCWNNLWKPIWEIILYNNMDSPYLFKLFATQFSQCTDFQCHTKLSIDFQHQYRRLVNQERDMVLHRHLLIGASPKHRIETICGNFHVASFINIHQSFSYEGLISIKISSQLSRDSLILLSNLTSITHLDVSGCRNVDDSVINSWCIAINVGKLPHLNCLILNNCPITQVGLLKLLNLNRGDIFYVESDISIDVKESHNAWKSSYQNTALLSLCSLDKWYHVNLLYYTAQHTLDSYLTRMKSIIVEDYRIVEDKILPHSDTDMINTQITSAWLHNLNRKLGTNPVYSYLLSQRIPSRPKEIIKVTKENKLSVVPKRKVKVTSLNSFFEI
ncbi:BA75_05066T0 [Komagataella pastoris]|uniref:BA75_05066T0 n=1 Tax=Komagataella pastoris TaxID=4922 RepID=A0A1B2JI98_PICPA|nr:BA75_05066T0 [Komagataella pastoris]